MINRRQVYTIPNEVTTEVRYGAPGLYPSFINYIFF